MSKKVLIASVIGGIAIVAVAAHAGINHSHKRGGLLSERMIDRVADRLELSDAKRDALFEAADAMRPQLREVREQRRDLRRAMRDLDPREADYQAEVEKLADASAGLARRGVELRAGGLATIAGILSDEEFAGVMEMREHFFDRHGKRGKRGHGHHWDD